MLTVFIQNFLELNMKQDVKRFYKTVIFINRINLDMI